jgi:hypothetical protein
VGSPCLKGHRKISLPTKPFAVSAIEKNELVNDYFASTGVEASSGSKTPGMIVPAPVTIASAVFKTASSSIVLYQADMKWRIA